MNNVLLTAVFLCSVFRTTFATNIEVNSTDKWQYTFFPLNSTTINIKVKAANDAHIMFAEGPSPDLTSNDFLEIVIGGWGNTQSAVRRSRSQPLKVTAQTPGIVSNFEQRGFWIKLVGSGGVMVGKERESVPFLSWNDPAPIRMTHFGVATGFGSDGQWKIETSESGELKDLTCAPGDVLIARSPWDGSLLHIVKEACFTALTDHSCHAKRKRFIINEDKKTWDAAKLACEEKGQKLASVRDEQEQSDLEEEIRRHKDSFAGVWLAANDRSQAEEFVWYDDGGNDTVTYNNWQHKKQPRREQGSRQHCVYASTLAYVVKNRAFWFLDDCTAEWHFACESIS